MRKRNISCYLFIVLAFCMTMISASAQTGMELPKMETGMYRVVHGERPPIDLDDVPADAYEPGRLKIKIKSGIENIVPSQDYLAGENGFAETGHIELDRLNRDFGVKSIKPMFQSLYNTRSKSSDYIERHKAWGLQLWFELLVDEKTDIIAAVKQFGALEDIEIAEPEYRKRLVIADPAMNASEPVRLPEPASVTDWAPNDPQYSSQWHYHNTGQQSGTPGADISLQEAWDIEKGNPQVIVAIIDGGIDYFHTDIAANMWPGIGYNFYYDTPNVTPLDHGTHVGGTVAAVNNNTIGVAGIAGGSGSGNGVRLMSCQVFISNTNGNGFHLAFVYAADNGAAITQNSWSYTNPGSYDQAILDAIDYFNINGGGEALEGGITIFAAGNSNSSAIYYPAYYSGTFSIASTNNQDQKAWYSNFNTWIDISAPGGETNTLTERGVLSTLIGNTYGFYQGTSMACPHASGVAALMISQAYGQLSASHVANILRSSADNHYGVNPGYIGQLGSGRLNAHAALIAVQNLIQAIPNPQNFVATSAGYDNIDLAWTKNTSNNDVMIVWALANIFGAPQNGTVYSTGEVIPGGGTVLYTGSNTTFTHLGLIPSTAYYYKAFSYDEMHEYSVGITATTNTLCQNIMFLPLEENFEESSTLPVCWEITDNLGNGQVWNIGSIPGGLTAAFGNYAYLNSDGYGSGNSQNSDLLSPTLDLTYYTSVNLTFNHYYRHFTGTSAQLAYSINNGATWTTLQTWTANTTNPATYNQTIAALAGQPQVKFRWKYTGTWGYYWCVDNIGITGAWVGPEIDFVADPLETTIGETLTFTDVSSNGNFSSWLWNFGEGAIPETETGQGPHNVTYTSEGFKTVSLTVDQVFVETKYDYIYVSPVIYSESATYTNGDIATDRNFISLPGASSCPGTLTVTIPTGAQIVGVDASYNMTATSSGRMSQQRSQLRCVSEGGNDESSLAAGVGNAIGTYHYSRSGLDIANEVAGGGNIQFQLHAGRTSLSSGCNTLYNKVDNNTWTITVYYTLVQTFEGDFTSDITSLCEGAQVHFSDLSPGNPTAWEWEFPGGDPSYSTDQNPTVSYNSSGTFDASLTVWFGVTDVQVTKPGYITVLSAPWQAETPEGESNLCANTLHTDYFTNGAGYASNYMWVLTPEAAGIIAGNNTMATVYWTSGYYGTAEITVTGINDCGTGASSDPLLIYIEALPLEAGLISGEASVCSSDEVIYSIEEVEFAVDYEWMLSPQSAGIIENLGSSCHIFWNETFEGNATLSVRGINDCGSGNWSEDFLVNVANCYTGGLPPGWDYTNTGTLSAILIPHYAIISIYGDEPPEGSWLGVFYTDEFGVEKCGGARQYNPYESTLLATFGNDNTTPGKDGFSFGEKYIWRIYNIQTQMEYPAIATYNPNSTNPNGVFGPGFCEILKLEAILNLQIDVSAGWSGFSLPFNPLDQDVTAIFSGVDELIILQNNEFIYWPEEEINTFPYWWPSFGAQLKMAEDATLEVSGIPGERTISLPAGWNYLPVMSLCDVDVEGLFVEMNDKIDLVKSIAGFQLYWPAMGINTLEMLKTGKAYLIKLNQPATITFPGCTNKK